MLNKKESTKEFNRIKKLIEQRNNWEWKYYEAKSKAALNARKKAGTKSGRTLQRRKLEAQELERLSQVAQKSKKRKASSDLVEESEEENMSANSDNDDEDGREGDGKKLPMTTKDPETMSRSSSFMERPLSSVLMKQSQAVRVDNNEEVYNNNEVEEDMNVSLDVMDIGNEEDDDVEDGPSVSELVKKAEQQRRKQFGSAPRVRELNRSQAEKTVDASGFVKPLHPKSYIRADTLYYMKQMCALQSQSISIENLRRNDWQNKFEVSLIDLVKE